jgi:hypothetical protein
LSRRSKSRHQNRRCRSRRSRSRSRRNPSSSSDPRPRLRIARARLLLRIREASINQCSAQLSEHAQRTHQPLQTSRWRHRNGCCELCDRSQWPRRVPQSGALGGKLCGGCGGDGDDRTCCTDAGFSCGCHTVASRVHAGHPLQLINFPAAFYRNSLFARCQVELEMDVRTA